MSARVILPLCLVAIGIWLAAVASAEPAVEPISEKLASADAGVGEKAFAQCSACHVAKPGAQVTVGPNLWNVVGRPVAAQSGYDYSESLKQVSGEWDFERLNVYLYDPKLLAPEGRMPFPGVKSTAERAHLIAYLRTLSDAPAALPEAGTASAGVASVGDDPQQWQGLPPGPGREEVFYRCKACHSLMIVKQQGLSRAAWDQSLEWMVEEQGMTPIEDPATRNRVLDYLATHFGLD